MTDSRTSKDQLSRALERVATYRKDPDSLLPYARSMVALADEIERLERERDQWKSRAQRINGLVLRLNADEGLSADALAGLQRLASAAGGADPEPPVSEKSPPLPKVDGYDRRVEGHYSAESMLEYGAMCAINERRKRATQPPFDVQELLEIVREVSTMDCFYTGETCGSADCECLSARASRAIVPRPSPTKGDSHHG